MKSFLQVLVNCNKVKGLGQFRSSGKQKYLTNFTARYTKQTSEIVKNFPTAYCINTKEKTKTICLKYFSTNVLVTLYWDFITSITNLVVNFT